MSSADIAGAVAYALDRLAAELPNQYTYHNLFHTQEDVLPAAERLAHESGVNPADVALLRVAAAFHAIGYIHGPENHELRGMRIVAQILPGFGFDDGEIETIKGMILATRLPQTPHTLLEQILADADLDALGRDDFFDRNAALHQEISYPEQLGDLRSWYLGQLDFLRAHRYFTEAARQLRQAGKQRNIQAVQARLDAIDF